MKVEESSINRYNRLRGQVQTKVLEDSTVKSVIIKQQIHDPEDATRAALHVRTIIVCSGSFEP